MRICMRARRSSKFSQIRPPDAELAVLEHKKPYKLYGKNGVATFSLLFLMGSSSYLQVTITCIRTWRISKFDQIGERTIELVALECLKINVATFSRIFFIWSFSYWQVTITCMRIRRSSKFGQIRQPTAELAAKERVKKPSPYTFNGKNGVVTFSQLFLIGSFSYLQVMMIYIRTWMVVIRSVTDLPKYNMLDLEPLAALWTINSFPKM